jgi:hypothetical protein
MENSMLKKIMLGAAVAALLASSAMAQSYDPSAGTGNIVKNPSHPPSGPVMPGTFGHLYANDFASAPPPAHHHHVRQHMTHPR